MEINAAILSDEPRIKERTSPRRRTAQSPQWIHKARLAWVHRWAAELPIINRLLGNAASAQAREQVASQSAIAGWRTSLPPAPAPTNIDCPPRSLVASTSGLIWTGAATSRPMLDENRRARPAERQSLDREARRSLRAFVLLSGTIRPTPFREAINRSIFDMPLENGRSILRDWQRQTADLAASAGLDQLPLRVLIDAQSPMPTIPGALPACAVSVERDPYAYRGSGGVLRDLAEEYDDDDLLLVGNGSQVLLSRLDEFVGQLADAGGDVSFISHADGTPSGLLLVRCRALRMISESGYVDLKEQALPAIAARFDVTHVEHDRPTGLPIRSMEEYLATLKLRHRNAAALAGAPSGQSGDGHDMAGSFAVIEPGASIDPRARLYDCVILKDARIEGDAVVVRSVVGPGAVLKTYHTAVDEFISSDVG